MASKTKIKRIGILTGGGDCPGLNGVIRAVANTAYRLYESEVYGIIDGFRGLIENKIEKLSLKDVSGILPRGGTILGTSNRDNPFKYPVQESKNSQREYRDVTDQVKKNIDVYGLDAIITVGGDGTQSIAQQLFEKHKIPVVGVPKTIDNDLNGTDITFGFDTALDIATASIDKLHSTAESHHRVMICEVMGRYAGWIALEAGIAGGGDVILIPEIPFKIEKIVEKINLRAKAGKRFSMVVVAEGAKEEGGQIVVAREVADPNDPIRLGGISKYLSDKIEDITSIETRFTILGHVQRGGSPSAFDRILATRFGFHAVEAAMQGKFGHMVGLHGNEIKTSPIKDAVAFPRRVEPGSDLIKTALAVGTSFGI
ncbi:MAG: 6-phosphofructokinase [Acidobacteria bacterium]|jgi:6-phosphofructokinase 1|nr:6-phosphofructokinase [Acidobacteriota bacterium]